MSDEELKDLVILGSCRLKCGWSNLMISKIKEFNPYCSFSFKRHWLKKGTRKYSPYLFTAQGQCKFEDCPMTINLMIPTTPKLDKFFTVIVEGGTTISHHSGDRKSRHIKGTMRDATMDTLSKVTPSYLQHHKLSLMRQDVYLSGNRDGIGCSKRLL